MGVLPYCDLPEVKVGTYYGMSSGEPIGNFRRGDSQDQWHVSVFPRFPEVRLEEPSETSGFRLFFAETHFLIASQCTKTPTYFQKPALASTNASLSSFPGATSRRVRSLLEQVTVKEVGFTSSIVQDNSGIDSVLLVGQTQEGRMILPMMHEVSSLSTFRWEKQGLKTERN